MERQATRNAAHDVLRGNASVVPLLSDGVHNVIKGVAVGADLNVVTDELSGGQSPLLVMTIHTPASRPSATACGRPCNLVVAHRSLASASASIWCMPR